MPRLHRLGRLAAFLLALIAGALTAVLVGNAHGPTAATALTHDLPGKPGAIAADAFDHIWFTDADNKKIGRLNTDGTIDEFPSTKQLQGGPFDVTLGVSDQNIWVSEPDAHALAVVSPSSGFVSEISAPSGVTPYMLASTANPQGTDVWFTDNAGDKIGHLYSDQNHVRQFHMQSITPGAHPYGIAVDKDHKVWFTEPGSDTIARLTPNADPTKDGTVEIMASLGAGTDPHGIIYSPHDQTILFTESGAAKVGQIGLDGNGKHELAADGAPESLTLDNETGRVYVATKSTKIDVFQDATLAFITKWTIQVVGEHVLFHPPQISGNKKRVWVGSPQSGKIVDLDPKDGTNDDPGTTLTQTVTSNQTGTSATGTSQTGETAPTTGTTISTTITTTESSGGGGNPCINGRRVAYRVAAKRKPKFTRVRVTAKLKGLPRRFKGATIVRVVDLRTMELVAVKRLRSARLGVTLSAGPYLVLVDAFPRGGGKALRAASAPLNLGAKRAQSTTLAVSKKAKARAALATPRLATASAAVSGGAIVTVNDIPLTGDGENVDISAAITGELFKPWHDGEGVRFIETGKTATEGLKKEEQLSRDGLLDVPTAFSPIKPDYKVTGHATKNGDKVTITIDVVDTATHTIVSTESVTGKLGPLNDLPAIARAIAGKLRPPPKKVDC